MAKRKTENQLDQTILAVIDTQIETNNPPFVRDIFEHLDVLTGSAHEAKELIGSVLSEPEMMTVILTDHPYDADRYHALLQKLFDRFDPEEVEITADIVRHPFCRMQREYDAAKWSGMTGKRQRSFGAIGITG